MASGKSKKKKKLVKLVHKETGFIYYTTMGPNRAREGKGKLELKKYNPVVRKHVVFIETK